MTVHICPHCGSTDVFASVWHSFCTACQTKLDDPPADTTPDVDPGVDTPVRPDHSLISSAAATVFEDHSEPVVDPLRRQTLGAATDNPEPAATGEVDKVDDVPPPPPSEGDGE